MRHLTCGSHALCAQEIPDLATANAFVVGSYDKYTQCIVNFGLLQKVSSTVGDYSGPVTTAIVQFSQSLPAQVFSFFSIVVGVLLFIWGYKLVRPVNFVAGAYLGGVVSLVLLNIFAPALANCPVIFTTASACGLLLGVLCALRREAMMVVLGVVAGDIFGDIFYKVFLAGVFPEYVAFGCIGFFAVLLGVLANNVGDAAWRMGCAFFGSYLALTGVIKLVLVPYVPDGVQFEGFLAFQPDVSKVIALGGEYRHTLLGSPYVYGPTLVLIALTAAGTTLQNSLLKKDTRPYATLP